MIVKQSVHGDSAMLDVLVNLLENALQHATAGSVIICKTWRIIAKGWLALQVESWSCDSASDQNIIFRTLCPETTWGGWVWSGTCIFKLAILAHNGMLRCESLYQNGKEGPF